MDWTDRFEKVLEEMEKVGKEYAFAKSQSWHLQELTTALKSKLMIDYMANDKTLSAQKAEAMARASDAYWQHLQGTTVAIDKELRLKATHEKLFAQYESYRSLISLDKKTGGFSA